MPKPAPKVQFYDRRNGWYVEDQNETHGPMESEAEAKAYALLLRVVNSARVEMACPEEAYTL